MGQRRIGQLGLLDAAVSRRGNRRREVLDEIGGLMDWPAFERLLAVIPVAVFLLTTVICYGVVGGHA